MKVHALCRSCFAVVTAFSSLLIALLLLHLSPVSADSTLRYVAPDGSGVAPCINSTTPCPSIQTALEAALPGDIIKVAEGLYLENLVITQGVVLRGGYTPADNFATSWPQVRETIIHAASVGSVISITNGATATIEGFTITGGNSSQGGGLFISQARPRIMNNLITGNSAILGGGIHVDFDSLPGVIIVGNQIESNTAAVAGGIMLWMGEQHVVDSNQICYNTAINYGGGLHLLNGENYIVRANKICSNTAQSAAGGLLLDGGQGYLIDSNQIDHNSVADTDFAEGGGIDISGTKNFTLTNNLVAFNRLGITPPGCCLPSGGGIHIGFNNPTGSLLNNTIVSNTLGFAGEAIAVSQGYVTLTNNIIAGHLIGITATNQATVTHSYNQFYGNDSDYGGSVTGPTTGELNADPLFVSGPGLMGDFYLSQISAGQAQNSPALDAGNQTATAAGLSLHTTRTDERGDQNIVDLGYHYLAPPFALALTANPTIIVANGISTTTLTAILSTQAGHAVPDGNAVVFSSSLGSFGNAMGSYTTTTTNGVALAALRSVSASTTMTATVGAMAGPVAGSTLVLFQASASRENTIFLPIILKDTPSI